MTTREAVEQSGGTGVAESRPYASPYPWKMLLVPVALVAVMTPAVLLATTATFSGCGFNAVVRAIEERYSAHATRIPFLSLMSGVAGMATHGSVHRLQLAEFDHFTEAVDGDELNRLVEEKIGADWQRIVRDTGRHGTEQTLIYVRPEGDHLGMMVIDLDGKELDVVGLSVNPEQLSRQIAEHRHERDEARAADEDRPTND